MPETFEGLAVVLLALLPGALYVWSFERLVGSWGIGLSDRILRFVGFSALFLVLFAPLVALAAGRYVRAGWEPREFSIGLWLAVAAYVAIPIAAGWIVGSATVRRRGWTRFITGPAPAPRAWDHLFGSRPDGWIRLRLRSGVWVGGVFSTGADGRLGSYASGYPYERELFLHEIVLVDPDTGTFEFDERGAVKVVESGLLIRWEEVEYLEFIDA